MFKNNSKIYLITASLLTAHAILGFKKKLTVKDFLQKKPNSLPAFVFEEKKPKKISSKKEKSKVNLSKIKNKKKKELCEFLNLGEYTTFKDLLEAKYTTGQILGAIKTIKQENVANPEIIDELLEHILLEKKYTSFYALSSAGYSEEKVLALCKRIKQEKIANKNFIPDLLKNKFKALLITYKGIPEKQTHEINKIALNLGLSGPELAEIENIAWKEHLDRKSYSYSFNKPKQNKFKTRLRKKPEKQAESPRQISNAPNNNNNGNNKRTGLFNKFFRFIASRRVKIYAYYTMFFAASSMFIFSLYNTLRSFMFKK